MPAAGDAAAAAAASHGFQRAAATVALLAVLAPSDQAFVRASTSAAASAARNDRGDRGNGGSLSEKAKVDGTDQEGEEKEEEEEEEEEEEASAAPDDTGEGEEIGAAIATTPGEGGGVVEEVEGRVQATKTPPKTGKYSGNNPSTREEAKRRQFIRHQGAQSGSASGEEGAISGGGETGPAKGSTHDSSSGAGATRSVGGNAAGAAAAGALAEFRAAEELPGEEGAEQRVDAEECRVTGPCLWCEKDELGLEYCKKTQRRQEVRCPVELAGQNMAAGSAGAPGGGVGVLPSSVRYRPCDYAEEDDFQGLFNFWLAMLVVGALACFGMRRRQQKGGSLYDRRAK